MPREGHDPWRHSPVTSLSLFQSTCPARGTTPPKLGVVRTDAISIHVPREGHDLDTAFSGVDQFAISIHVPREGHDQTYLADAYRCRKISIHVPREGHDNMVLIRDIARPNFNPRAPRGARHQGHSETETETEFQSTCPARGTTANMHNFFVQICARVTNIPLKGMPYLQKTYVSI